MAVAAAAVNTFRTVTKVVGLTTDVIYESPVGFVGVFVFRWTTAFLSCLPFLQKLRVVLAPLMGGKASWLQFIDETGLHQRDMAKRGACAPVADRSELFLGHFWEHASP